MGVVKALKALAEIPPLKRSEDVKKTIEEGAEYMLKHHIHKRSHNLNQVSIAGWLRFGFPRMYQADVLEILGIMTKLGYRDERMQEAVDLVLSKQDEGGAMAPRQHLQRSFPNKHRTRKKTKQMDHTESNNSSKKILQLTRIEDPHNHS